MCKRYRQCADFTPSDVGGPAPSDTGGPAPSDASGSAHTAPGLPAGLQPRAHLSGVSANPEPATACVHPSPTPPSLLFLIHLFLFPGSPVSAAPPPLPAPPPPPASRLHVPAPPPTPVRSLPHRQSRQRWWRHRQSQTWREITSPSATYAAPENSAPPTNRLTGGS